MTNLTYSSSRFYRTLFKLVHEGSKPHALKKGNFMLVCICININILPLYKKLVFSYKQFESSMQQYNLRAYIAITL